MAKTELKIRARKLRKNGQSIKVIAQKLDSPLTSISRWCRDIQLTPSQTETLIQNSKEGAYRGRLKAAANKREKRLKKFNNYTLGVLTKLVSYQKEISF